MLPEERRKQLDTIVTSMVANKEDDETIRFVVDDFKQKYSEQEQADTNPYGATFRASPNDNPLQAGLKAAGNVPSSALNLGKGLFSAVTNPIDTAKSLGATVAGGIQKLKPGRQAQEENFDAFTGFLKERYGSLENLQKTATEDPFGFGSEVLSLVTGGAALAGKSAQVSKAIGTVGKTVTKPVAKGASAVANTAKRTTKFGVSQATGLNPETITELLKNPQRYKNINPEIRTETATKVAGALEDRLADLSDMGKGYQTIREAQGFVSIPSNTVKNVLGKYGVKLDKANKIVTSAESRPLSTGDRVALQDFIDNYGSITNHSNNSFLNTREALSNLAKYDTSKTNFSTNIARDLRQQYDALGKAQIKDLGKLDAEYAPERQLLGDLKKDIFDAKGELKDTAVSRIANLTGKGKERVLERVKQVLPDIEERVKIIKTMEDIERTQGIKVGTYTRTATQAVGVGGLVTGNVPAIVLAILAQPEIAVPLLRGAGYVGQKAAPIINAVKAVASDVNNLRVPTQVSEYVQEYMKNPKVGMSIEDVTKRPVSPVKVDPLLTEARKYKSAEEFVNNKINVFHATNEAQAKSIERVGYKPSLGRGFSNQPGDFAYFTPSVDGAIRYSKTSSNGLNKITSGSLKGKILKIEGTMPDFEAFGKAQEQLGVPLGIDSRGNLTMLDVDGLKKAMRDNGYSAIEFKDRYSNGAKAIAAIPEDVVTKSQLTDIYNQAHGKIKK